MLTTIVVISNVPSKSSLSVRGTEGRLRGRLKHVCICLVVNTYEVRGRTEVLRGRAAAQLRGNVAYKIISLTSLGISAFFCVAKSKKYRRFNEYLSLQ